MTVSTLCVSCGADLEMEWDDEDQAYTPAGWWNGPTCSRSCYLKWSGYTWNRELQKWERPRG